MKFYLFHLGCKVNAYEIASLKEALLSKGHEEALSPEEADIIVLNTCSVTATSDQKSRQKIRKLRKSNEKATLVVMGCYSERHAYDVSRDGADIVLGTASRDKVISYWEKYLNTHEKIIETEQEKTRYETISPAFYADRARAYLKIQDGCNNRCSYCLIPFLRGPSRSRDRESVLQELSSLAKISKEVVVTGIHIGFYGKDFKNGYLLSDLLEEMLQNKDLYRLRISSLESSEIDDKLVSLFAKYPSSLASHLHIPLQSGSSKILKSMGRPYDSEGFLSVIEKLRKVREDIAITTDVIVGYPEETEEDFLDTMEFCRKARFAEIHVFPFSAREGTRAAKMVDIAPQVKKDRVHRLLALSKELREDYEKGFLGQEQEVLMESYDPETKLAKGHTSNYLLLETTCDHDVSGEVLRIIYDDNTKAD